MSTKAKLLVAIVSSPVGIRYADACKAAELLGFVHKGGAGSHRAFARGGEPMLLNFQDRGGVIPPYQGRQLAAMVEKYGELK